MKKRFIDTWFWQTLIVKTEPFHKQATEFFRKEVYQGTEFYTSGSVIAETINGILFSKQLIKAPEKKLRPNYAYQFSQNFEHALKQGSNLKILTADQVQVIRALELLNANVRPIPKLSYFDCESVILCRDHGLEEVLTGDAHFEALGMHVDAEWQGIMDKGPKG